MPTNPETLSQKPKQITLQPKTQEEAAAKATKELEVMPA